MTFRKTRRWWLFGVLYLLQPTPVFGHLASTGLGPFYDGISHFFISPEDLLAVTGLSLLAGLAGKPSSRFALFGICAAWLASGLLGLSIADKEWLFPGLTAATVLITGALVALDWKAMNPGFPVVALGFASFHGFLNGTAVAGSRSGVTAVIGTVAAVFVLVTLASALVVSLRADWTRIVVRVAGSWIAAIGLLMLGWTFRGSF